MVNEVSAFVYTRPEKVYATRGVPAMAYSVSSQVSEAGGDMTFVIRRDRKGFFSVIKE